MKHDSDIGDDMDTDTLTQIIIKENDIIHCNHMCRVGVGVKHRRVSDTRACLIRRVSMTPCFIDTNINMRAMISWQETRVGGFTRQSCHDSKKLQNRTST